MNHSFFLRFVFIKEGWPTASKKPKMSSVVRFWAIFTSIYGRYSPLSILFSASPRKVIVQILFDSPFMSKTIWIASISIALNNWSNTHKNFMCLWFETEWNCFVVIVQCASIHTTLYRRTFAFYLKYIPIFQHVLYTIQIHKYRALFITIYIQRICDRCLIALLIQTHQMLRQLSANRNSPIHITKWNLNRTFTIYHLFTFFSLNFEQ